MTNFNGMVVATAKKFNSENAKLDKNGKAPVYLNVLTGKAPNRNILAGTIAESEGIEVGKTYLLNCKEVEASEQYGRQFVWSKVKELDFIEIMQAQQLGATEIFDVENTTTQIQASELSAQEVPAEFK